MGIVLRAFANSLIFAILIVFAYDCGAEVTDVEEKAMINRIKERCADFYKRKREADLREADRQMGAAELHKIREARDKEQEKARVEYIKTRKTRVEEDPRLEREWEAQDKAWREQNKIAGQRYSRRQRQAETIEQKGCHLSEKEEYGLEE